MSLSSFYRATVFCAFMATGLLRAQHLTISTGGQTGTSGTNWSITGNTLNVTASNVSAHIHPSVITNHLTSTGDLTIVLPWVSGIPRDLNINSSIAYTGSTARTLTFNIVNDIIAASGISITSSNTSLNLVLRTAMSTSNTDHGRIQLDGTTITTNGGHFWAGGGSGSSTWNSLTVGNTYSRTWADDVSGVSFLNASLTTSGGNIYMAGMSYNTSDADGENYGINIRNSSITSGAGQIDILGDLKGMYTTGSGLGIFGNSGTVTISSTTGAINLTGTGADQAGTNTGWRRGALLYTLASTGVSVTSTSGNITITGTAAFPTNGNDDMMGLQLGTTQSIADGIKISSQTGNIRLAGSNTREAAGQNSNAVQFIAANTSNSIRIGYNGTNAYSGNITVEGNSIIQNNVNAGSGSISVQSTGTLTIQPSGNAFTYLRSGASGSLTFDDDWAFGTTFSGFTFGKSTNTLDLSYAGTLTVAGPITFHTNSFTVNNNITSSTASNITINANANFNTANARQIISSAGGNITIHADKDANGSGVLDLDYLTLNPGAGNIIIRGSTFNWTTNSSTDKPYLNGTGSITIEPSSASFSQEPNTTWFVFDQDANGMSGLTIGKSGNTTNITYSGTALTVAGPVTLYGGTLTLSSDLTCTASGDVSLYTDAALAISSARTITTTGAFKYISQSASFAATVSFPITNLTLTNVTGVQIGKSGNTAGVTVGSATSVNGYFTAFGGAIALNSNITTTNTTNGDITLTGTTLSGTGNLAVANGRTASITVTSASTYEGIISGTGSALTKLGAGALTLTKDQTYTGATTISAGDLQVGTGGSVSQASSGSLHASSAVSVASGSKIILAPNENITFANAVSGAGGLEIKGMSGRYYSTTWIDGTASTFISNATVLEVLTRVTGGKMGGTAVSIVTCAAYQKAYNAATNTGTFQMQVYNDVYTKCVFMKLTQSGTSVMIQVNTSVLTTGAGYKNGNVLGTDISSGGTSMTLATTSSGGSGYGISEIYLSGKVNFTGSLTYSGTTTLSNTVSSVTGANAYSYTSKGTQEITDASTSFPSGSAIVNNGLVIFNRTTALTVSNDMSGTEEVLQVGAEITMTGANTYTGNTTVDLNKTLNIGSGSTTGSMTGNIINYGTLTFNRSDSSAHAGIISGSGAVTKNGNSATTLTGLNTYTGATTINAGRLILQRDVPATSSSGYSGAGILVVQPNSNSFTNAVTYPIAGFTVSSSIGGLTIGKPTNTANITVSSATTAAGPITMYGGNISVNANLNTTGGANGDILLQGTKIAHAAGVSVLTNSGDITYQVSNSPWLAGSDFAIAVGVMSGAQTTIDAQGGNISLMAAYAGSGSNNNVGLADLDAAVLLANARVKTNSSGTITIDGNAFNNSSTNGSYVWGVLIRDGSLIQSENGDISISATGGKSHSISRGIVSDQTNDQILSSAGTITFTDTKPTGNNNYLGMYLRPTSTNLTKIGADGSIVAASSSNLVFNVDHITFDVAATSLNTSGTITIRPVGNDFTAAVDLTHANIINATAFTAGKAGNTANITTSDAKSIAGPISLYGGTLTLNQNLSSTAGGNISLYGNTLTFASGKTVSSTGELLVAPSSVSTTVGLAGATGTLQVTSTHLSTNFVNGFSNITIGSDAQTGNISSNAFTLQDNMTFKTSGTLSLAGNITLGTNNATLGNALSMGTGTNYFLTNSTGVLKRSVGNAGTFAFPVGNSAYNPVSITNNTGAADEFNLRVLDEVYRNGTSGSVLTTPRVKRTWLIGKTNANAGSGINFVFNWNTGESTSGLNSPRLYHYNGTEWDKQTGTTSSTSSSLTYTGYTGTFSPFAIGDDIQALPVTLLYFNCHANENKGNVLRWATATELNSKQFEVERSTDGKIYQTIGKIPAAGHSLTTKPYEFIDKSTVGNMTAYRLKMIDEDGSFKYSEPCVVLHHESGSDKILIYPNPSQGSFTVEAEAPGQFKIVDAIGRVVQQGNISGKTTINGLLPGVYFITFQTEEKRYTQKVVVE